MINFLIADDSEILRKFYKQVITRHYKDADIDEAPDGEEALAKAIKTDYDIIISDICMPIMNGITFYQNLKELKPGLSKKIGFISSNIYEFQAYLTCEGCSILPKPFNLKDFYQFINSLIDSKPEEFIYHLGRRKIRIKRFKVSETGVLEPVSSNHHLSEHITAEITDYSINGLGLKYSGKKLPSGTKVHISVKYLNIFDKRGEVIWSKPANGNIQSGVHWI